MAMRRGPRPEVFERTPLSVGSPLNGGAWAVAEFIGPSGRHLQYKAMGRALRKAAVKEYFPPNWKREGEDPQPQADDEAERNLRDFFRVALEIARDAPSHPNLVVTYEVFEERGTHYGAYEWIDGQSLNELIRVRGPLPAEFVAAIASQVGEALTHLHGNGLLHRDVNPSNILIDASGRARLTDFETISPFPTTRRTPRVRLFNPDYVPIEQFSTFPAYGPESDVYALAASVYDALTGRKPPIATSRVAAPRLEPVHRIRPELPPALSEALDRAMRVRAKERTPTPAEFIDELLRATSGAAAKAL